MAKQQARITPYYMIQSYWETDIPTQYIIYFDTAEELFRSAAEFLASNDSYAEDFTVDKMVCECKECFYAGWMPDMEYRFVTKDGEIMFDKFFPEWDH